MQQQLAAHAPGTVNSVDPAQHKINLSHPPIPSLGWPAMTKEFPVATSVDLGPIKPGSRVNFSLGKGKDGMYRSAIQGDFRSGRYQSLPHMHALSLKLVLHPEPRRVTVAGGRLPGVDRDRLALRGRERRI